MCFVETLSGPHASAAARRCRLALLFLARTGRSTGPHTHYEVSIGGQLRNPEEFLAVSAITGAASR